MNEDSTVVRLRQLETVDDPLTEVLRRGRRLFAQAVEAEAESLPGRDGRSAACRWPRPVRPARPRP